MYFEKFTNGGVAAMEPVSHIDILLSAQEAMQESYEAELALMEEEGGAYIQAAQLGSEGIGDAAAAIGEKAKELGSAMLKKLQEFIRKVKAFFSNFINSMRQGAIVSTLKAAISKSEKRIKASDSDWAENAPDPKKVVKWNADVDALVKKTLFVTKDAVSALINGTSKSMEKIKKQWNAKDSIMTGTAKGAMSSFADPDLDAISNAMSHSEQASIRTASKGDTYNYADKGLTKWLGPMGGIEEVFHVSSGKKNMAIAKDAATAAQRLITSMQNDPVLNAYRAVQELEREVNAARGLAQDAGKDGSKQAKFLKKLQGLVHKSGTTATLMARKQLGSWKTLAALNVRMFSMAGSKERDDYKED